MLRQGLAPATSDETSLEEARAEALAGSHFLHTSPAHIHSSPSDESCGCAHFTTPRSHSASCDAGTTPSKPASAPVRGSSVAPLSTPRSSSVSRAVTSAYRVEPDEGLDELAELRFTEEMANEMDLNALRELSSVRAGCRVCARGLRICILYRSMDPNARSPLASASAQ